MRVILCGAGISMAPPSSVASWWGFNQAVLDELRCRFRAEHQAPVRAAKALERLSLESLDLAEFSQVVSDAFAGDTWFDALEALDGEQPNVNHYVLAELAKRGRLQLVLTTNLDTLIERAMRENGMKVDVRDAFTDPPPTESESANESLVVKLHGTASRRSGLVDLASQKRRGLPSDWRDWLHRQFKGAELLVMGFSGADLAIRPDYLCLEAAAPDLVSLRWLASSRPTAQVDRLLHLGGTRFRLIPGHLPQAWTSLGVDDDLVGRALAQVDAPEPASATWEPVPAVGDVIERWLAHPMVDADTCGLALTRLLDAAGRTSAAQALRVSISTRVRRALHSGLRYSVLPRAALRIGQIAADEPPARARNALYCLDLASRALDALIEHSPVEMRDNPEVQAELAHNRANLVSNRAYVLLASGGPAIVERAAAAAEEARTLAEPLTGLRHDQHESSYWELCGAIELLRGDRDAARTCLLEAHVLALRTGNRRRQRAVEAQLRLLDDDASFTFPEVPVIRR